MTDDRQGSGQGQCVLAVVCPSPLVLSGLERMLADAPGMTVGCSASSAARLRARDPDPDLLIIDVSGLPSARLGTSFWAALPRGRGAVMLCRPEAPPDLIAALRGGVRGFLTHACQAGELVSAVQTAWRGGVYVSPDLARSLIAHCESDGSDSPGGLSHREGETLRLVAAGLTHRQISRRLGVTEATVSTYVRRIRVKLDAGNKADLTRLAIQLGYASR